jgi:hypothetical protein
MVFGRRVLNRSPHENVVAIGGFSLYREQRFADGGSTIEGEGAMFWLASRTPQRLTLCGRATVHSFGRPIHLADSEAINPDGWRE